MADNFSHFSCRLEAHLHERLQHAAKKDRRSVTAFLNCLIEKHVPQSPNEGMAKRLRDQPGGDDEGLLD